MYQQRRIFAGVPSKALRSMPGWTYVPVTCMAEIPVKMPLNLCIRVLLHLNTHQISTGILQQIYQAGAKFCDWI